jgi:hypothetical protein
MSDDIVKRLREADPERLPFGTEQKMCDEAADEIVWLRYKNKRIGDEFKRLRAENERLRHALADVVNWTLEDWHANRIARAALKEQP